jgi:tetratricopeptide (TPR) repeat protein/DNA-binding CsgD family transcriptional regulator
LAAARSGGKATIDANTVSRWERGVRRPRPGYVHLLSLLFEKSPEELGLVDQPPVSQSAGESEAPIEPSPLPLTGRMLDVARLVAEGLSNREIAERLFISERTVEGHLERIRNELSISSRVQLATLVQRHHRPGLAVPPGAGLRAEGPLLRTLRIGADKVTLVGGEVAISHRPRGLDAAAQQSLWELERARRGWPDVPTRLAAPPEGGPGARLHRALIDAGAALGRSFLAGAAGAALRQAVAQALSLNEPLELALEVVDGALADLPWETLRVPAPGGELDEPLVLQPHVNLYRSVPATEAAPAIQVRGPLRVLVAIGSPETDNERGELLDYEAELKLILDVVQEAREHGGARVRILERGTAAAIHEALSQERFHVLHVSCHAGPGVLVLEDEKGRRDPVDVTRFVHELLPAGRGVPLVVLAGCSTAQANAAPGEVALPGVARGLLAHGVPAVLAMNAIVSDSYSTRLMGEVYRRMAVAMRPDPLMALSDARREVEAGPSHTADAPGSLAEWATPVLFRRGPGLPFYDVRDGVDEVREVAEPALQAGIVVRRVGEFVGRRREQRLLLWALRKRAGVVIHGLGGVGKSTLAAQLVSDLAAETALVVSLAGEVSVDQVLGEVGLRLFGNVLARSLDEKHPYRELAQVVRNPQVEWRDRLGYLAPLLLNQERVVLLLDNFEDNLEAAEGGWRVKDPELGSLLSSWLGSPGRSRLILTSRYPFLLTDGREARLEFQHLGPLSLAETRKLIWRLSGLSGLSREEQQRAYADVGGHPRALEYLDALLRGGEARFADVAERMEHALGRRGITRPRAWMADVDGDLDRALAETVTLAVDDVLLGELVERLEPVEGARLLLLGASVYRLPVDEIGLRWQAGEEVDVPADPAAAERQVRLDEARAAAAREGRSTGLEELGLESELVARLLDDQRRAIAPPLQVTEGFGDALGDLGDLGLIAPVESAEEGAERSWAVHRWTAAALAAIAKAEELAAAHRRAARYWRWRVEVWPQSRERDVLEQIEARYHLHAAGDLEDAAAVTEAVVSQLDTWGAWGWEERLCLETLAWLPEVSRQAAAFQHQLGTISQDRGDYEGAVNWYRRSLAISEELRDPAGVAGSYHQLGNVAYRRGDYVGALDWYGRSLAIKEELGDRAGIASSYHQLGNVAYQRGDYDAALEWYRRSLAVNEELGDPAGMASSYHQLGMVAHDRGDYDEALDWYRRSLAIKEKLGSRAGIANGYHQLGRVAQDRGDYSQAVDWYRRSLILNEELGDRTSLASSYHHLGMVAQAQGIHDTALDWYRRSAAISEEIGNRAGMAATYHQIGTIAQVRGDYEGALEWYRRSLALAEESGIRAGT